MNREITKEQKLADLVTIYPGAAQIFNRHNIDYCCGGDRTLEEAAAGSEIRQLIGELREAYAAKGEEPVGEVDWVSLSTPDLIEHIIETHHVFTREQLREIDRLASVVLKAHFENRGDELLKVHRLFGLLKIELEEHLVKEEELLFPRILTAGADGGAPEEQLAETEDEHEAAGALIHELHETTRGFTPPPEACGSYRELYARLKALTEDVFMHVHKENNVLFTRLRE